MNRLTVEIEDTLSSLLELASNNDVTGFKKSVDRDVSAMDEVGDWYGRKKVMEQRTPLMVAATYGSLDVLRLILAISSADVNRSCGADRTTALHCAASGGSSNAVEAVKILLSAGADPNCVDANGHRPADVIVVPGRVSAVKTELEDLLGSSITEIHQHGLRISTNRFNSVSAEEEGSPDSGKIREQFVIPTEKKEYPIDPTLPDIKNSIYSTDEFRMFSFKVRPCSRAYSHDWTECPFVHPGENARRRDPRKYHYSCVPCPEFRKGACRRGDMCEYAHGVFECWLHPAQYRTRLCKDGTNCSRRVCFFAHTNEEMRPLYVSTGSGVPSPRHSVSASVMEMAAMGIMPPGSPSSISALMSCFAPPPMSPPSGGISHSAIHWPHQPNVPPLHIPGNNGVLSSRLRSSVSARDIALEDHLMPRDFSPDFESQQLMNDYFCRTGSSAGNRSARSKILSSNLEDLFAAEVSLSPRHNSEQGAMFSPSHKAAILNQFQLQQSLLAPINTGTYSPKPLEQQHHGHPSLLQASLGLSLSGRMSPRGMDAGSPVSARLMALAQREKQQQQTLRSLSSRDLGGGGNMSPMNSPWSKWSSPSQTLDWGVNGEELGHLRRSSSFEIRPGGEVGGRDFEWVQSLVKDSPPEKMTTPDTSGAPPPIAPRPANVDANDGDSNSQIDALGAWLEQLQLDQMVA